MKKTLKIPFYSNLKDDNHCLQACFKMVLKYYFPNKSYSFKKLDKLSKHINGKLTWQGSFLLELFKMGFKIENIENLDYNKFAKEGKRYLKTIWSKDVFNTQNEFSDLKQEQKIAGKMVQIKEIELIYKGVAISDVEKYFKDGFFVMVSVNPCVFAKKNCYWSHLVLVTGIDKNFVTFHDPGLPPVKNRKVSKKLFEKSMTKPYKEDTNLIAIKK